SIKGIISNYPHTEVAQLMSEMSFLGLSITPQVYAWVILPLLIFCARIIDVSAGTIRFIFISRGMKNIAPFISFFEIFVWLLAIRQIMQHMDNPACFLAYAAGFATGTYVGMNIESALSLGTRMVRIIARKDATELIESLRGGGYGVTSVDARGSTGTVQILFTVVRRGDVGDVIHIVKEHNPNAFFSIEDVGTVNEGIFPLRGRRRRAVGRRLFCG
ncbi:MAG: DUF2179 domain-containing protein, partial [Chitinispirillaceae bacterium]